MVKMCMRHIHGFGLKPAHELEKERDESNPLAIQHNYTIKMKVVLRVNS